MGNSESITNTGLLRSASASDGLSPIRKKARPLDTVATDYNFSSIISLNSCPESIETDDHQHNRPLDQIVEEPPSPSANRDRMVIGPLTREVMARGFTTKFATMSDIFRGNEHKNSSVHKPKSSLRKLGGSLNLSRLLINRKRKLPTSNNSDSMDTLESPSSRIDVDHHRRSRLDNSDWPVPFIETIFLPEYPSPKSCALNEHNFSILGTIASGAFGKVHRVCLTSHPNAVFAMKVQSKWHVLSMNAVRQIKDEVTIHASVSSGTFISTFYTSWQSRSQLYTVLQYVMGYGDLYTLWRDYGPFDEDAVRIYAAEISLAIDFIHSKNVIYRDLKMENLMLDEQGHIQVVDFGLAKRLDNDMVRTWTICGTLHYMAPEVAHGKIYTKSVDYWSFGVLIHVLLTSRYPLPSAQVRHHSELIFDEYIPSIECSTSANSLIAQLLCIDPDHRLQSLSTVQTHSFFDTIDFTMIAERKLSPFQFISKMKRCASCNSLIDRSASEISNADSDLEENMAGFEEHYDFDQFDYFNDYL